MSSKRDIVALGAFAGLTALAAFAGARTTARGKGLWYPRLRKAKGTPPDAAFAPVWTVLYGLSAASGFRVWQKRPSRARTRALSLWAAQLALNANFSRLFFGRHRPDAALVDLAALGVAVALYVNQARSVDRAASWMTVPYLGWVGYAGYLNEEIVRKNPRLRTLRFSDSSLLRRFRVAGSPFLRRGSA
jgi:tryptophan-rich sensory protein